jgi:hypothetical protein
MPHTLGKSTKQLAVNLGNQNHSNPRRVFTALFKQKVSNRIIRVCSRNFADSYCKRSQLLRVINNHALVLLHLNSQQATLGQLSPLQP